MSKKNHIEPIADKKAASKNAKPGWLRRFGGYLVDTLDPKEKEERDLFQIVADTVLGEGPAEKISSGVVIGGGVAAGVGSAIGEPVLVVTGLTTAGVGVLGRLGFSVNRRRKMLKDMGIYKGEVEDAPEVEATDDQAVEAAGMSKAAQSEDNAQAVLGSIATGEIFQLSEGKWNQLWQRARARSKMNKADSSLYNAIVRFAEQQELVTVAS